MTRKSVLLVGATGATGNAILQELIACKQFEVHALIRRQSLEHPRAQELRDRGVQIRVGDVTQPVEALTKLLSGVNIVISAISPQQLLHQINLVDAAKAVGVERFVPCSFSTLCPVGGVVKIRDDKEAVNQHIFNLHLPYTIIDTGFWYQASFPRLRSGRVDYAVIDTNTDIFGGGNTKDAMIDLADIARYTARTIADHRTLNKKVFCYGQVATQNEIMQVMEDVSGEKPATEKVDPEEHLKAIANAETLLQQEPANQMHFLTLLGLQYNNNRFIRRDNVPKYAWYLGYLNARELYPDLTPRTFKDFAIALLAGQEKCPYAV